MKSYDEIKEGQVLYTAKQEEVWDEEDYDTESPLGITPQYTKYKVEFIDGTEVYFKIMDGQFKGKQQMWAWWGDGDAKPEDLLTKSEYEEVSGDFEVTDKNFKSTIKEIEKSLAGINLKKFKLLVQFYENKS